MRASVFDTMGKCLPHQNAVSYHFCHDVFALICLGIQRACDEVHPNSTNLRSALGGGGAINTQYSLAVCLQRRLHQVQHACTHACATLECQLLGVGHKT